MSEQKTYVRFSLPQRLEHILLIASFTTLALTGMPQKYPLSPVSLWVTDILGGVEALRIIHRVAATVFLLEAIYHLVVVGYKLYVLRQAASMTPGIQDGLDAWQTFLYNLGLRKEAPRLPRYNFAEKAEYWAMLWGLLVMAVSGFMLWNPIATTNILPGEFIPAAKVAHGGEAGLAVLAIIVWHIYNVHLKMFNKSMFTGRLDRHAMQEEHALELEQIDAGRGYRAPEVDFQRRRMTVFAPVAAVVSIALLAGVYWFVSFEETSLTTAPPAEQAQVFVTLTPTTPPPTPTTDPAKSGEGGSAGAAAWSGDLDAVFKEKCASCHGVTGGFTAETYQDVIKDLIPGNADESAIIQAQRVGHMGMFSEGELERVAAWIDAGAPEQPGGPPASSEGTEPAALVWEGSVDALFTSQCKACHGSNAIGGVTLTGYAGVLEQIEVGDPQNSPVVIVQQAGNHPGKFRPDQLQVVIDWIAAGALEK